MQVTKSRQTLDTAYDWNYTVTNQVGMNGRSFAYPRGRILGGCSTASKCILRKPTITVIDQIL
jgi:choline dehydrogenase-like flavoprotein